MPFASNPSAGPSVASDSTDASRLGAGAEWWRTAVIYQIYPRSFADSNGDGMGDLAGIAQRLPELRKLGVDAIWLSPFFTSPQNDGGYDVADYCDVDPLFGTLEDFDRLASAAHDLDLRVIVDIVPNHTSSEHAWFREALAAEPGSDARARYIFRDGLGSNGDTPPNNWRSVFGGRAWTRTTNADGTPGQWYLHLFDASQPDLDWENPWVREQMVGVLRFWLDRGVDGFRVDVAHGMVKAPGLPDYTPPANAGSMGGGIVGLEPEISMAEDDQTPPYFGQDGVHEIYRVWRRVLDEYDGDRALVAEAWVEPLTKLARWVRPDEMHQAFNFTYLETPWAADALRRTIDASISAFGAVGAPSTWVLSNHDVVRHASRLGLTGDNLQGAGIGPTTPNQPDPVLGLRRARAASALMLGLPGSAYVYQGEELGLPEVIHLPEHSRQDPTFFRSNGERYGRDGCRVPIPWEASAPAYGFSPSGASWLPQPAEWAGFARDAQQGVPGSTLELYTRALARRTEWNLGLGALEWLAGYGEDAVAFRNNGLTVIANLGSTAIALPDGEIVLGSEDIEGGLLPGDTTVWIR